MSYYNKNNFPTFDLKNGFILREKRESDLQDFFNYYTDIEVNKYILCEISDSIDQVATDFNYWKNAFYINDGIYFGIAEISTDKLIGSIGLTSFSRYQSKIELSYDLAKEYWRKGICSKAIMSVLHYAFNVMHVNRVEAIISVENIASQELLYKLGFKNEGRLRQYRYHKGKYVDIYIFSILREDFAQ